MQNNRREIQPPQEKEDEETGKDEGSDEAEKCKTIVECDEIRAIAEELKDQMEDGEKNEVVIGDVERSNDPEIDLIPV